MQVDHRHIRRPIWLAKDETTVEVIDQRKLPHQLVILPLATVDDAIYAIKEMVVRGAPLIGVTAAYGIYLAALEASSQANSHDHLIRMHRKIKAARPTAVNLAWAADRVLAAIAPIAEPSQRAAAAKQIAGEIADEEAENCRKIGQNGLALIEDLRTRKASGPINILTHCNAGWLACVEHGTATAPMYAAAEAGIDIHIWVDETRPLNQGARLTAWELGRQGIAHTIITDNAGGHLMQHGMVDVVIVGTDRTTCTGDVANKIGTYLKALAARDNGIPFYVALPSTTFDWKLTDGLADIPIEQRDPDEIRYVEGKEPDTMGRVLICPPESPAANYAFDVTPARLVSGFITERGVCAANRSAVASLFPEYQSSQSP